MGSNEPSGSVGAVISGSVLSNTGGLFDLGGEGSHVFWVRQNRATVIVVCIVA
jgi:hypothetical protein